MTATIILPNNLKDKLQFLSRDEYKQVLFNAIGEVFIKDERLKKFSVYRRSEFYKYCLCVPKFEDNIKVIETKEQREGRLELRKELELKIALNTCTSDMTKSDLKELIQINLVAKTLCISKKNLDSILISSGSIKCSIINNKKYIHKQSFIDYLNNNHFVGTGITEYKTIEGKKGSKEYKEAWEKYSDTIPVNYRVIRDDVEIEDIESGCGDRIYNIYLKICEERITEIPNLQPINRLVPSLELCQRTLTRYCDKGVFSFYKIGKKYMISKEDINDIFDKIERYKLIPTKRSKGCGKRSKLDRLLYDLELSKMIPNDNFKELIKSDTTIYFSLLELKRKNDKKLVEYKNTSFSDLCNTFIEQNRIIDEKLEILKHNIVNKYLMF